MAELHHLVLILLVRERFGGEGWHLENGVAEGPDYEQCLYQTIYVASISLVHDAFEWLLQGVRGLISRSVENLLRNGELYLKHLSEPLLSHGLRVEKLKKFVHREGHWLGAVAHEQEVDWVLVFDLLS